ncbi:MAG: DUF2764 family protein [Candidatus Delongbacteria bacterium]|nr:DUF2764 family protein [Candidatus Delongbacteria bacterium]
MSRKYYCLVAGLPNITLEDSKLSYGSEDFLGDLKEFIHPDDYRYFKFFKFRIDNENIYKALVAHEHEFLPGGNFSPEDIEEILDEPVKAEGYIREFIEEFRSEEFDKEVDKKRMTELYYSYITDHENSFANRWFNLELNMQNIFAALTARKFGMSAEEEIINLNEVSEALLKSGSRDFGLTGEFEHIDKLISIFETEDLVRREKEIDLFKWEWLNDNTFFNYFTIEQLISYYIKLRMIERWITLDPATGKELFEKFTQEMLQGYEIPEEFEQK